MDPLTAGQFLSVPSAKSPYAPSSSHSLLSPPSPSPPPPLLRTSRSATNLTSSHRPQTAGTVDGNGNLLVDFVVDDLPRRGSHATDDGRPEVRRVRSSTALGPGPSQDPDPPKGASKWKNALGEAQFFAGGLVSRPAESNRHFSVIRHSHALIWYRGPSTSISITVLSDTPLPADRRVWLQQKGYSGNVGMSLKALVNSTGSWVDVTPARQAQPEHIAEIDERGIQRDLKRFAKKASGKARSHVPRETHVVRIPAVAVDGYFRLVVCAGDKGKKVLCGSPVFRVASTSTDMSVTRGASVKTMPLEVGVKVASNIAEKAAMAYAGAAGAVAQSRVQKVLPSSSIMAAGRSAYEATGVSSAVTERWAQTAEGRYNHLIDTKDAHDPALRVVGPDQGPVAPFPFTFEGRVVHGSGRSTLEHGIPTANLRSVPDTVKMRMKGVYAGWASILPSPKLEDVSCEWHESIITIAQLRHAAPEVVMKNRVTVHFIHDFDEATFFDARVRIVLMAYLHAPAQEAEAGELMEEHDRDVMTTLASLARDNWGPEESLTRVSTMRSERSFSDRVNEATGKLHQGVDKVPLHRIGMRSESGLIRDVAYGNGGIFIPR